MPGHVPADLGEIGLAGASFMNELPVKHYDQVVGQFQQFVEILADQQHCGATVAGRHDLGMDLRDRREIEPEAGIGGDQHLNFAAELPCQYCTLHVAARHCRNRGVRRAGIDLVRPDLALGTFPERRSSR